MTTLFEPPAQAHSPTSVAAARAIRGDAQRLRDAVMLAIQQAGEAGLTDEEGITLTGISPSTYRPRRCELVEYGRVIDSGRTRLTHSKRKATVWTVAVVPEADPVVDMAAWYATHPPAKLPD